MSDSPEAPLPSVRVWTRVAVALLLAPQVAAATFLAAFIVAAAGCDIVMGSGSCGSSLQTAGALAVIGFGVALLIWWVYALIHLQRAGLIAAVVFQIAVAVWVVVALGPQELRHLDFVSVGVTAPGTLTLALFALDPDLRRLLVSGRKTVAIQPGWLRDG